jgi:hypothetical protein
MQSGFVLASVFLCNAASAFVVQRTNQSPRHVLCISPEDDIPVQLERARALLAKSKKKLEAREATATAPEEAQPQVELPFFAAAVTIDKRERVIKSRNAETGLITADGEKMARLSEEEPWEVRSLMEVFQNENEETDMLDTLSSKHLAERDVAASIFNLRKQMKVEDYRKIFDSRNFFIGEDN